MERSKVILVILILSLILIGIGYAGWTEKFTSTSNINTGNLQITYEEEDDPHGAVVYSEELYQNGLEEYNINMNYQYIHAPNSDDPGSVKFDVTNIVPGTVYWSKFKLRNTGSVPAALENVIANVTTDNWLLKEKMHITIKSYIEDDIYYLSNYEPLVNLDGKTITPDIMQKLKKNEYMTIYIKFNLEETDFNDDECEKSNLSLTLDYNFMQANIWTKAP
ncbi:hypothetical protein PV797_19450 [Clostridiaceae bacterium M8S5]|nr:hypothetical protein PV797_19450 [Clostridiaceae bacterium M8S5]